PMRQAGAEAAQGLAQGIRSQLGAVTSAIRQLVQAMIREIRKALKSHSPSLVMAEIGETIPQGVALGLDRASHMAIGPASRPAASTVQPWGHPGGGGAHSESPLHGVVDRQGAAREIHQLMRDYKNKGGGIALGLG